MWHELTQLNSHVCIAIHSRLSGSNEANRSKGGLSLLDHTHICLHSTAHGRHKPNRTNPASLTLLACDPDCRLPNQHPPCPLLHWSPGRWLAHLLGTPQQQPARWCSWGQTADRTHTTQRSDLAHCCWLWPLSCWKALSCWKPFSWHWAACYLLRGCGPESTGPLLPKQQTLLKVKQADGMQ